MNILVISDAFFPNQTGGITKSVFSEVKGLASRNHRVVVLTRRMKSGLPFHESFNDYELYRYPSPSEDTIFYRLYPFFSLKNIPKLIDKLHKKNNFDVAYVHNAYQAVGLSRCLIDIPCIYVFYAPMPLEIQIDAAKGKYGWKKIFVSLVNRWVSRIERQALLKADAIIVRSQFTQGQIDKLYGNFYAGKTFQIPLGVNMEKFSFVKIQKHARKKLNLPQEQPVLLTVRRLSARMGIENLIKAMARIVKYYPNILLLIGGKGYLEDSLKKMIHSLGLKNHIHMIGFIPEEKLSLYYQAADLFVLPTVELEGFGLSTIESLACGTPVIATPVGANPEVLGPLDKNFICEISSPDSLSEKIVWWLENDIGFELRKKCRDYCKSSFDIKKVVFRIEQVLYKGMNL